jgi:repressor LexA
MFIGDLIKEYRTKNKMSLRDFASRCGLSHTYISALEKNIDSRTGKPIAPTLDTVKYISKGMNMQIEDILKILDDEQEFIVNEEVSKSFVSNSAVVLIYGTIPAGVPMEMIEDVIDTEEIDANMLKGGKQYFGLKIKGNSMYPEYLNNDTIICEKVDNVESGTDAVVMVNGNDGTFKRVIKNENGIILQPLNPEFQPMVYTNEQIEKLPIKVIGKVVELRRKK